MISLAFGGLELVHGAMWAGWPLCPPPAVLSPSCRVVFSCGGWTDMAWLVVFSCGYRLQWRRGAMEKLQHGGRSRAAAWHVGAVAL